MILFWKVLWHILATVSWYTIKNIIYWFSSGEPIDERGPGGEKVLEQLPAEIPEEGNLGGFDPEGGLTQ